MTNCLFTMECTEILKHLQKYMTKGDNSRQQRVTVFHYKYCPIEKTTELTGDVTSI